MAVTLQPNERRVLGVLIEKSLSSPEYYPMTINGLVTGSNQKSNRDPVMSLSEGEVGAALHELKAWGLATQASPSPGSRSNKFEQTVHAKFGWGTPERAVMAELLLRGPQTAGELRNRASRMTQLASVERVQEILSDLASHDPPFVRELPRGPGQSATRVAHCLYPADEALPAVGPAVVVHDGNSAALASPGAADRLAVLEARVIELESTVAELRERLS